MYLGLAVCLLLVLGKFVQETVELARHTGTEDLDYRNCGGSQA
jgi:hypothetical protein